MGESVESSKMHSLWICKLVINDSFDEIVSFQLPSPYIEDVFWTNVEKKSFSIKTFFNALHNGNYLHTGKMKAVLYLLSFRRIVILNLLLYGVMTVVIFVIFDALYLFNTIISMTRQDRNGSTTYSLSSQEKKQYSHRLRLFCHT